MPFFYGTFHSSQQSVVNKYKSFQQYYKGGDVLCHKIEGCVLFTLNLQDEVNAQ